MKKLVTTTPSEELMSFESFYNRESKDLNNYSFWAPKLNNKSFKMPETLNTILPKDIALKILDFNEKYQNSETVKKELLEYCQTLIDSMKEHFTNIATECGPYFFIKNARFSNKFDFNNSCKCFFSAKKLLEQLVNINYASMCVDALGFTEVVLREFLPSNPQTRFSIYNGMPLRPEYRVFYDFNRKKILHIHNYWDYKYVYPNLNANDRLIFKKTKKQRDRMWDRYLKDVIKECQKLKNVELEGVWSVDFLVHTRKTSGYSLKEKSGIYLIDMALAQNSAYWNPSYLNEEVVE